MPDAPTRRYESAGDPGVAVMRCAPRGHRQARGPSRSRLHRTRGRGHLRPSGVQQLGIATVVHEGVSRWTSVDSRSLGELA
jgi:hypothetical protein